MASTMAAQLARSGPSAFMAKGAQDSAVYRFPVYHMRINGEPRAIVAAWKLYERLRKLKLLNIYSKLTRLGDRDVFEVSSWVHGKLVHIEVRAARWAVYNNPSCARPVWMRASWK